MKVRLGEQQKVYSKSHFERLLLTNKFPERAEFYDIDHGRWLPILNYAPNVIGFKFNYDALNSITTEIENIKQLQNRPNRIDATSNFIYRATYAFRLLVTEKELIIFALLQWSSIALGYYLWVQMLGWIPESTWENLGDFVGIILLIWSFICVGVASFPLGFFTSCMGAAHLLHKQNKNSTIAGCFQLVLPRVWPVWLFSWLDGWLTVDRIVERLPKEEDWDISFRSEAIYYAWKIGSMGVLPSLVSGKSIFTASKESVSMVRYKLNDVAKLRIGYSLLCWLLGISSYVGSIIFFINFKEFTNIDKDLSGGIYTFFFWMGVPILVSVAIIQLFIRPIYIISLFDIYSDFITEQNKELILPKEPSKSISAFIAFTMLCLLLFVVFLYRNELGIIEIFNLNKSL